MRTLTRAGNPHKRKGDEGERETSVVLRDLLPEYAHSDAMRILGAGRKFDIGDQWCLPDVAIQVKRFGAQYTTRAMITSALSSAVQAQNARVPHGLGLVIVENVRKDAPHRYLACATTWPSTPNPLPLVIASPSAAIAAVKDDPQRVLVTSRGATRYFVSTLATWCCDYRGMRQRIAPASGDAA